MLFRSSLSHSLSHSLSSLSLPLSLSLSSKRAAAALCSPAHLRLDAAQGLCAGPARQQLPHRGPPPPHTYTHTASDNHTHTLPVITAFSAVIRRGYRLLAPPSLPSEGRRAWAMGVREGRPFAPARGEGPARRGASHRRRNADPSAVRPGLVPLPSPPCPPPPHPPPPPVPPPSIAPHLSTAFPST